MRKNVILAPLLDKLEAALVDRNIKAGFLLLDRSFPATAKLEFSGPRSISVLLCVAQWVDLGYRDVGFFDQFAEGCARIDRAQISVLDFLKLRLAEAYRCLTCEQIEESITALNLVLQIQGDILPAHLVFLTHFWKGRAHRKRGDYEHAQFHIAAARRTAEQMKAPRLVAFAKIHESWLSFQRGERQQALEMLNEAERSLRPTGHGLSLGNIESARGRFVRRSGEYTRALDHFEAAIAIYKASYPNHPNLARAMVNAAYVKRLIALELQPRGKQAIGQTHAKSIRISGEALDLLDQALKIYVLHRHQAGTGSVLVNAAHLHLESGDIDRAAAEGVRALALGKEKGDQILMARAHIVLSAVELERAEEQVGEQPDVASHAGSAVEHADKAIALALQTQNKRLLAEAFIARGFAAAGDYFQEWEVAKDYASKASALLTYDDRDHLFKLLRDLKSKIVGATRIDDTLRMWTDGQLGGKTFQQIQEEFAELVIPKVWINSGRNVTVVSKQLRISPKKVRRLLRNAKLTD